MNLRWLRHIKKCSNTHGKRFLLKYMIEMKKILKYLFIQCILLSFIFVLLTACSDSEKSANTPVNDENTENTEFAETTAAGPILPEILKSDYKNKKFTVLYPNWSLYNSYYFSDELNGEIMNDTLYERISNIEDVLNIDFTTQCLGYIDTIQPNVTKTVLAGLAEYDLALTHCISGFMGMAQDGVLLDWHDIPVIDMNAAYWNKNAQETFTINNKLFYNVNDFILPDINTLFFNKGMINNYSLESPYDKVTQNIWTWDKLLAMAVVVTEDINGDGVMNLNDQYGYVSDEGAAYNVQTMKSYDIDYVSLDKDGIPYIALDLSKLVDIMDGITALVKGGYTYTYAYATENDPNHGGKPPLGVDSDQSLFSNVPLSYAEIYRLTEVDFGIIPYPKYNESQEKYMNLNVSGFMCIPLTAEDTELVGKVVELLGYYGGEKIIPAFYNIVLNTKVSRDKESEGMLDIIFANIVFDLGWNSSSISLQDFRTYKGEFTSFYEKHYPTWEAAVKKIADIYNK